MDPVDGSTRITLAPSAARPASDAGGRDPEPVGYARERPLSPRRPPSGADVRRVLQVVATRMDVLLAEAAGTPPRDDSDRPARRPASETRADREVDAPAEARDDGDAGADADRPRQVDAGADAGADAGGDAGGDAGAAEATAPPSRARADGTITTQLIPFPAVGARHANPRDLARDTGGGRQVASSREGGAARIGPEDLAAPPPPSGASVDDRLRRVRGRMVQRRAASAAPPRRRRFRFPTRAAIRDGLGKLAVALVLIAISTAISLFLV